MLHRRDPIVVLPHAWLAVAMLVVCAASAQAQVTLIYDTFTGANGTSLTAHTPDVNLPLTTWTIRTNGAIALNGNAVLSTQGDGYSWPSWAAIESNTCDGTIAVDWTPGAGLPYGPRAGLIVRMSDALNYWFVAYGVQGTGLALWKVVNGSAGLVTSTSVPNPLGATHHLEVRLEDSSIQVWYDGAQKIQWTDAFNAWSTMHGVEWDVNTDWASKFDNFTVQTPSYQTVSSVVVTPTGSLTGAGAAQFLTATALNAQGQAIPDALFHWTVSDSTHGTLSTTGHYAAAAAILALSGDVTVTAEMLGGPSGAAAITVDATRTTIADAFTGANGTSLTAHAPTLNTAQGTWSVHATQPMTLQSGQLTSAQTDCPYQPVATINGSTSDGTISADWTPGGATPVGGVIVRASNDYNYWFAGYGHQSTKLALFKYVSGSPVLVTYMNPGAIQGRSHHIEVRLAGANIELWWDGTMQLQASDAYLQSATRHGLMWGGCADATSTFDNFAVQLPPVTSSHHVTVSPATASLPPGGMQIFTAQAFDASNATIPGTLFHWTISSSANGQIRSTSFYATSATVYGVTGTETVTATPVNGAAGTASVTVDSSSTLLFDTFTGSNVVALPAHTPDINVVGTAWTAHTTGDIGLYNNRVHSTQQDAPYEPIALVDASTSDGIVAVDWTPADGLPYGPVGGLLFRATDAYNAWFAGFGLYQSGLTLCKFVSGGGCQIVTTTAIDSPLGATHHLEVRLAGPSIQVWWDGVLQLQASDSYNVSATKHGLMWGAATDWLSTFDNFAVRGAQYPTVSSVVVTPATPTVALGGLQILTAQAFDAQNQPIPNALFHWTINDPTGAVLVTPNYFSSSAIVRAVAHNVTVSATMAWGLSGSASVVTDATHVLAYDTFTAPDNSTLPNHLPDLQVAAGAWQAVAGQAPPIISANHLIPAQSGAAWQTQATIDVAATDVRIGADWTPADGLPYGPMVGILFRGKDPNNFWVAGYGFMTYPLALWQVVHGNWVPVIWASPGNPLGATHHLEVVTNGLTIEVWWDGVRQIVYRSAFASDGTGYGIAWWPAYDSTSSIDTFSVIGSSRCTSTALASNSMPVFSGASGSLTVTAPPACQWSVESDAPWITFPSGTSGTGNNGIPYAVAANATYDWRVGNIAVGGRLVTIVQQPTPPPPCTFALWPNNGYWAGNGGTGGFDVTTTACTWTASTGASWIHLQTTSGSGSATVSFAVDSNSTAVARTGTISVGGWPSTVYYTITQGPAGTNAGGGFGTSTCSFRVSPFYELFSSAGGDQPITITAPPGCASTVVSNPAWVALSSTQGTGPWSSTLTIGPNTSGATRSAAFQIAGVTVITEQNDSGSDNNFSALFDGASGDYSHSRFAWLTTDGGQPIGQATTSQVVIVITVPGSSVPTPPTGGGGGSGDPGCEGRTINLPGRVNPMDRGCGHGRVDDGGGTAEDEHQFRQGSNYSQIDILVVIKHEGGNVLKAYWPPREKSGVTVCAGVDIGQRSPADLERLHLDEALLNKLSTFTLLKGQDAENHLNAIYPNGLILSEPECDSLNTKVFDSMFVDAANKFNDFSGIGTFTNQPWQVQTVFGDLWYNQGDLYAKASIFFGQMISADWCGAYHNLQDYTKADPVLARRARSMAPLIWELIPQPSQCQP